MAEREQLLNSFKEVCAVDDAKAQQFLAHCEFNLERAVQLFFQTGGVLDNTNEGTENARNWENENNEQRLRRRGGARNGGEASSSSSSGSSIASDNSRRPGGGTVAARQMSWLEWFVAVATLPINLIVATLQELIGGIWGIFGGNRAPEVTDARGDVARFISKYEELAAAVQSRVQFSPDTFMEVCQRAKREVRPLLVFIHDDTSAESGVFLREALSSHPVGNIIAAHNICIWGISTTTPEGVRVSRQLRSRSPPALFLMTARDGRMITTLRLQSMPADQLAMNLAAGVNMVDRHLRQLRQAQQRREEDSRIRAEQEQEYKEALAADRAKKEERERKEREAREREEAARRAEEEREECRRIFAEKRDQLRSLGCGEADVEGEAVRVQIRYPSGEKMERKFGLDETVESLFNAAISHASCPPLFSLHTNYPRRALAYCPGWYAEWRARAFPAEAHLSPAPHGCAATFRDEHLTQSLVVMVQDEAS